MKKLVMSFLLLQFSVLADAAMVNFTTACRIRSFDTKEIKCEGTHVYVVPRSAVLKDQLKKGDVVVVVMTPEVFDNNFSKRKPASSK